LKPVAIETKNLRKIYNSYGVITKALDGVDIKIEKGEFVVIIGPSGSGKSTLLNIIGALDLPSEGSVFIDGIEMTKLNTKQLAALRNQKVGFIFQSFNLVQRLTAIENVELPMIIFGQGKDRRKKAYELLKMVGLEERWNNKPYQMSGGEQQRVAIARSLANRPAIIFGDEPTGNLDTKTTSDITNLLKDLNKNTKTTLVIITHDLDIAKQADRIITIRDGKVEDQRLN
tara:strand:- start:2703 stop:3389 length:687 start_codon:yes stop_codon:yes gene_type:complete